MKTPWGLSHLLQCQLRSCCTKYELCSVDANNDDGDGGGDDNNPTMKASTYWAFPMCQVLHTHYVTSHSGILHPHCPHPPPSRYHLSLGRQWELLRECPCLSLSHLKSMSSQRPVMMPLPCLKPPPCSELPCEYNPDPSRWWLWALPPHSLTLSLSLEQDTQPHQLSFCSPINSVFLLFSLSKASAPGHLVTVPHAHHLLSCCFAQYVMVLLMFWFPRTRI